MTLIYSAKKNKKLKFTTLQRHKHVKKPLHHRSDIGKTRFMYGYKASFIVLPAIAGLRCGFVKKAATVQVHL